MNQYVLVAVIMLLSCMFINSLHDPQYKYKKNIENNESDMKHDIKHDIHKTIETPIVSKTDLNFNNMHSRNSKLKKLPNYKIKTEVRNKTEMYVSPSIHGHAADIEASKNIKVSAFDEDHIKYGYEGNFFGIRRSDVSYFNDVDVVCINNNTYQIKRIDRHKFENHCYIYITKPFRVNSKAHVGDRIKLHMC